jgi:hypothetical protein
MAWLKLCEGAADEARELLLRAGALQPDLPALVCNEAHCHLLEGNVRMAIEGYLGLAGQKNESHSDFRKVIQDDLKKLQACKVLPEGAAEGLRAAGILKTPAS